MVLLIQTNNFHFLSFALSRLLHACPGGGVVRLNENITISAKSRSFSLDFWLSLAIINLRYFLKYLIEIFLGIDEF